jgi:N-acetylmuramoyl-L-alanine amidase
MNIVISSGHGKYVRGASGYLDEVNEARKVVERVAEFWREAGVGVKTFHDDTSTSQNQNLTTIVNYHNSQQRDRDVSVHFNAYTTTAAAMGTEVLYVTQQKLAADTSLAIAQAGTFINRGAKKRTDLYFLNNTAKPAVLLEVCFVDSSADADLYRANFETICRAIAEEIGDVTIGEQPPSTGEPGEPPPDAVTARVDITVRAEGKVIVSINGQDLMITGPGPETPVEPLFPPNQCNIVCTVFGGSKDPNDSAYQPYDEITDSEISCALPYRFLDPLPTVEVINIDNNKTVECEVRDIGPWNVNDPYWQTGQRPQAESGTDMKGRTTNLAGIDLTPAAAKAIGLEGKGKVNWRFVERVPVA